jgi:hypothetical protein
MAKAWAWSYSKYKAYDSCPKRFYEVDIAHNFADSTEQLDWGNEVHKAIQLATEGKAPLPDSMKDYQKWVDEIKHGEGTLYVEQQYAITKDFQPTQWFAHNVWLRGICDVLRISPSGKSARARDYKTGGVKHDANQLMLMSQCIFVHHPTVQRIRAEFVWLKEDCVGTPEVYNRDTIVREWPPLLPQLKRMEEASRTLDYPPKPCGLCARWCPVLSCQFHGKRFKAA